MGPATRAPAWQPDLSPRGLGRQEAPPAPRSAGQAVVVQSTSISRRLRKGCHPANWTQPEGQLTGRLPAAPWAPAGLTFYPGSSYPVAYRGNLFISEWGSNFTYADTGHVVERVVLGASGTVSSSQVSVFASGIQHPISVVQAPDGALLVADWGTGIVYRIQAA